MPVVDYQQAYQLAKNAGATDDEARVLAALPGPESSYDTATTHKNKDGSIDRGLWQINSVHGYDPDQLVNDPAYNAHAAVEVLRQQGFDAWTTYKNGAYKNYLGGFSPGAAGAMVGAMSGAAPTAIKGVQDSLESRLMSINSVMGGHLGMTNPPWQSKLPQGAQTGAVVGQAVGGVAQQAIDAAKSALGKPYVWGGNSLATGVDCSGLIQQAFKAAGIDLPRVSNEQARAGQPVPPDQMQPGDILWWDYGAGSQVEGADHVALYLGNGKMIEALHRGEPVHIVDVRPPTGVTRVTGSVPQGSFDPNAKQVEVGPNDSLGSRLAAVAAAISSSTGKVSAF